MDNAEQQAPPADFAVGSRVYVGGSKKGSIAFLGATRFATGEWAGVVLDEPVGKNDGSVNGVRYFTCQPLYGIFCKTDKLTFCDDAAVNNIAGTSADQAVPPDNDDARSEVSSISFAAHPIAVQSAAQLDLSIGDRVVVSDTKVGAIRYIGETRFAPGTWIGVELDEPLGKNDGSVSGVRYFACRPLFGVFAPAYKVRRLTDELELELKSNKSTVSSNRTIRSSIPSLIRSSKPDLNLSATGDMAFNLAPSTVPLPGEQGFDAGDQLGPLYNDAMQSPNGHANFSGSRESLVSIGASSVCSSASRPGASRLKMGSRMPQPIAPTTRTNKSALSGSPAAGKQYKPATHAHNAALAAAGAKPSGSYASANAAKQAAGAKQTLNAAKQAGGPKSVGGSDVMSMSMMAAGAAVTPSGAALQKFIKEKDDHIVSLQRELHDEQTELAKQTARADTLDHEIVALKDQVATLEREKASLNERVEEEKKRVEELEFEVAEFEATRDDGQTTSSGDDGSKRQLETDLRSAKEALGNSETRNGQLSKVVDEAQRALEDARKSCEAYVNEINQLRADLVAAKQSAAPASSQEPAKCRCEELSGRVTELELEKAGFTEKMHSLQCEFDEIKTQKLALAQELDSVSAQLAKSGEQIATETQKSEKQRALLEAELGELRSQHESLVERSKQSSSDSDKERIELSEKVLFLQKECRELDSQKAALGQELESVNARLAESTGQLATETQKQVESEKQRSALKAELDEVRSQLERSKQSSGDSDKERTELAEKVRSLQSECSELQAQKAALGQEFDNVRAQLAESTGKLAAETQKHVEIEKQRSALKAELDEVRSQYETLLEHSKQNSSDSDKERVELAEKVRLLQKECSELNTQKAALGQELATINARLAESTGQLAAETQKHVDTEKQRALLEAELGELRSQHESLVERSKQSSSDSDKERIELSEKIQSLQKECRELDSQKAALGQELESVNARLAESTGQLATETQKQVEIEKQRSALKAELDEVRSQLERSKQSSGDSDKERIELTEKIQSLQKECSELNAQKAALGQEFDNVRTQLAKSVEELAAETQKHVEIEKQRSALKAELDEVRSQLERSNQSSSDSDKERIELTEKIQSLQSECSDLQAQKAALGQEFDDVSARLAELTEQRAIETQKRNEIEKQRILLKTELDEVRLRYESLLERSKQSNNDQDQGKAQIRAPNGLEHDPAFCSSVIADLKTKVDRLTSENEQLRKGKLDLQFGDVESEPKTKRAQAPRSYCDNCEIFDAHETENCPNSSHPELESRKPFLPVQAGRRPSVNAPRLYCDTCENFGHSTAECAQLNG